MHYQRMTETINRLPKQPIIHQTYYIEEEHQKLKARKDEVMSKLHIRHAQEPLPICTT